MTRINYGLGRLSLRGIWDNEIENRKVILMRISQIYFFVKAKYGHIDATGSSLALYNILWSN